jgi:hypothetical protein
LKAVKSIENEGCCHLFLYLITKPFPTYTSTVLRVCSLLAQGVQAVCYGQPRMVIET